MTATLFELDAKTLWTGGRSLVPLDRCSCPDCGGLLSTVTTSQPALFVHGGFGATEASVTRWCPACRWSLAAERQERRP